MCEPRLESEANQNPKLMQLYVSMDACKKRFWAGCRPIIGLDGCFVKGPHRWQLLAAVEINPDNAIYPIGYAMVD